MDPYERQMLDRFCLALGTGEVTAAEPGTPQTYLVRCRVASDPVWIEFRLLTPRAMRAGAGRPGMMRASGNAALGAQLPHQLVQGIIHERGQHHLALVGGGVGAGFRR